MIPWHQRQSTLFGDPEPESMASLRRLQQARERHLRLWQTPGVAVADIAAAADEVIVATVRWDLDEIACRQLRRQPRSWRDGYESASINQPRGGDMAPRERAAKEGEMGGFWKTYYTHPESANQRVFEHFDDDGNLLAAEWDDEPAWAVVEIMGHREHRGEVRHKPGGGIEVRELQDDGTLGQPIYYGSSAIFAIRYVSCREALIKEER